MATKTFEELKQLAIQIRDEKTNKQNTATRIGTQMLEHLDKLEQDYYDKTATDEELKERDEKLTKLEEKSLYFNSALSSKYICEMYVEGAALNDKIVLQNIACPLIYNGEKYWQVNLVINDRNCQLIIKQEEKPKGVQYIEQSLSGTSIKVYALISFDSDTEDTDTQHVYSLGKLADASNLAALTNIEYSPSIKSRIENIGELQGRLTELEEKSLYFNSALSSKYICEMYVEGAALNDKIVLQNIACPLIYNGEKYWQVNLVINDRNCQLIIKQEEKPKGVQYIEQSLSGTSIKVYALISFDSDTEDTDTQHVYSLGKLADASNLAALTNIEYSPSIKSRIENEKINDKILDVNNDCQNIISELSNKRILNTSGMNIPIVCFIYDDGLNQDIERLKDFDNRNLKVTYCPKGNGTSTWGDTMKEAVKNGHGILAHGLPYGEKFTGTGFDNMPDNDIMRAVKINREWCDKYNLPTNGIAYFNTMKINAHTIAMTKRYYKYAFCFGGDGINTPEQSFYTLTRKVTDGKDMLSSCKKLIDDNIGKNCIIAFGGHFDRTATGDGSNGYSTYSDFTALLDYVSMYKNAGLLISLSADNAINELSKRAISEGVIKTEYCNSYDYTGVIDFMPFLYRKIIKDNKVLLCTNAGVSAVYKLSLSGTPTNGSFKISMPEETQMTITTSLGDSITDVINKIINVIYKTNTIREINTELWILHDRVGICEEPTISDNTSGISFNVETIKIGVDAVYEEIFQL